MNSSTQCITDGTARQQRTCPACGTTFTPRRSWASFCSSACRTAYDQERGMEGKVARVSRLKSGVSVTLHFSGPAAERALNLGLGDAVRVVKQP